MHLKRKVLSFLFLGLGLTLINSPSVYAQEKSSSTKKRVNQGNKTKSNVKKRQSNKQNEKKSVAVKRTRTRVSNNNSTTTKKRVVSNNKSTKKNNNRVAVTGTQGVYSPPSDVIYSVYDLDTSQYLEKQRIHSSHSIASLTKLMSSYVFLNHTPSLNNCFIKITEEDNDKLKNTRTKLPKNSNISCNKILEATLSLSDNYAASSLSRHVPNMSQTEFIKEMNKQAKKWNMQDTYFADASGLNPSNKSTANDLTKFLSKVVDTKEFSILEPMSTSNKFSLPTIGKPRLFSNTNKLIREDKFEASLSKTGFINESGYNLMFVPTSCANNKKLALVIMGERTSYNRSSLATQLLNKYKCK